MDAISVLANGSASSKDGEGDTTELKRRAGRAKDAAGLGRRTLRLGLGGGRAASQIGRGGSRDIWEEVSQSLHLQLPQHPPNVLVGKAILLDGGRPIPSDRRRSSQHVDVGRPGEKARAEPTADGRAGVPMATPPPPFTHADARNGTGEGEMACWSSPAFWSIFHLLVPQKRLTPSSVLSASRSRHGGRSSCSSTSSRDLSVRATARGSLALGNVIHCRGNHRTCPLRCPVDPSG